MARAAIGRSSSADRSSCDPVTAKKNGTKIDASGLMSCSSSSAASVSATTRPATNAPMMAARPTHDGDQRDRQHDQERGHEGRVREQRPGEGRRRQAPGAAGDHEPEQHQPDPRDADQQRPRREVAVRSARGEADQDERQDVVHQGRPDHDLGERPVHHPQVPQDAAGDADAGGRERESDEHGGQRRLAHRGGQGEPAGERQDHGDDRRQDRRLADLEQVVGPDLEANREQQDDDAQLGEQQRSLAWLDEPQAEGTDDEPAEQLADDRRLPEPSQDLLAQLGTKQEDEQAGEDLA